MILKKAKIFFSLLPLCFLISCSPLNKNELAIDTSSNKLEKKYNFNLTIKGTNYSIHDGDTIELKNEGINKLKIQAPQWNQKGLRFFGIDTPEVSFFSKNHIWKQTQGIENLWSNKATNYLKSILKSNNENYLPITIQGIREDHYGREIVKIDSNSQNLGIQLVKNGFARVAYVTNNYLANVSTQIKKEVEKYIKSLYQAQNYAKSHFMGFWKPINQHSFKFSDIFPKTQWVER